MAFIIDNEQFRNHLYSWPEKALVFLYDHYYDQLIRIADMHTQDRGASEDVLQEVFADVWQKHKVLGQQRSESIQAYLIKAVAYHSITFYKKKSKAAGRQLEYLYDNRSNLFQSAEAEMISAEKRTFARMILGTFPLRERQCLLMQIDEEMSVKDIAKRLHVSNKAVERSLSSARKRLKRFRTFLE